MRHLCGLAVFENYLYTVNSDSLSILRIHRYNGSDVQALARLDNAKEIRVFQKRTQAAGKIKFPLSRKHKTDNECLCSQKGPTRKKIPEDGIKICPCGTAFCSLSFVWLLHFSQAPTQPFPENSREFPALLCTL